MSGADLFGTWGAAGWLLVALLWVAFVAAVAGAIKTLFPARPACPG